MILSTRKLCSLAVLGIVVSLGAVASAAADCYVETSDLTTSHKRCYLPYGPLYSLLNEAWAYDSNSGAPVDYKIRLQVNAGSATLFGFDANDNELCGLWPAKTTFGPHDTGSCGPNLAYFTVYGAE